MDCQAGAIEMALLKIKRAIELFKQSPKDPHAKTNAEYIEQHLAKKKEPKFKTTTV